MQFKKVLENAIQDVQLTRVRLKIDPALCKNGEIEKYQGYEGYIIAEDGDMVRVYLECGGECAGSIVSVPSSMINVQTSLTSLEKLKLTTLKHYVASHQLTKEDALTVMIASASSPEALEMFLREAGATDAELLSIYKSAFLGSVLDDVI